MDGKERPGKLKGPDHSHRKQNIFHHRHQSGDSWVCADTPHSSGSTAKLRQNGSEPLPEVPQVLPRRHEEESQGTSNKILGCCQN